MDRNCSVVYDGEFQSDAILWYPKEMAGPRPFVQIVSLALRCHNISPSRLYGTQIYPATIETIANILRSNTEMSWLPWRYLRYTKVKKIILYPFLPNKYEMQFDVPSARCACTTSLKTSSSIISQRYSLSSSLSFHFLGSICQNSCKASNLCFSFLFSN